MIFLTFHLAPPTDLKSKQKQISLPDKLAPNLKCEKSLLQLLMDYYEIWYES